MKRTVKTLFIAALALLAANPVLARTSHGQGYGRVLERLERQHTRIERGIESSQLTRREARQLKKQQRRIRHLAYDFYEDGRLSKRERRILKKKQNMADDRIHALKHNDDYRRRGHHRYRFWIDADGEFPQYSYAW